MARVLIVEDSADKLRRIYKCLGGVAGLSSRNIENCIDAAEAKRRLSVRKYELLIIDIAIPRHPDQEASMDGGMVLLEEISEMQDLIVPDHIIGLTAYEELEAEAQISFGSKAWSVVRYSANSDEWQEAVRNKAAHIVAAEQGRGAIEEEYSSDLAIVCALDSELEAVRSLPWAWVRAAVPNDHTVFYRGEYVSNGGERTVHAAAAGRMGMTAAAVLTTKMIQTFRPRYVAMTGIAAGVRGRVDLGDVIVADSVFDYGSGKFTRSGGSSRFLVDPHHIQLSPDLRPKVRLLADDDALLSVIRKRWPGAKPDVPLKVHLGPMASGAAVLADGEMTESLLDLSRKLLGIDMEAYGVFAAASEASSPRPVSVVMKAVCDFADEAKEDSFQQYAAYTSASVLAKFAEDWF